MNSLVRAAKSAVKVNGLGWRYEANLSIAQSTVRRTLSVGSFFSSVFYDRLLAYTRVFLAIFWICVRSALAPVSLASLCSHKSLFQLGKPRIGVDFRRLTSVSIASVWAWPQVTFKRLAFLLRKRESRRRPEMGGSTEL